MTNFVKVCPQLPTNDVCPVTEIYVNLTEFTAQQEYSQALYDAGFSGMIELFVAGIGIGAIIAIISKLRR